MVNGQTGVLNWKNKRDGQTKTFILFFNVQSRFTIDSSIFGSGKKNVIHIFKIWILVFAAACCIQQE